MSRTPQLCTFRWIVFSLFFVSGACGLVYEVVWSRLLVTIFGNNVYAAATVLASFMAGLGLGAVILGRLADRRGELLKLYAWLEIGIGLAALAVPVAMAGVERTYVALGVEPNGSMILLNGLRFVLSFGVLLIPTSLMGGTLPVLSRFLVRDARFAGGSIGFLYALNTLGAMVGTLVAGFWLVASFGMNRSALVAVTLNLAVGFAALILARVQEALVPAEGKDLGTPAEDQPPPESEDDAYPPHVALLSLLVLAASGFTALAYEIVFFRILVLVIGTTVYAFSTMLATFLAGLALGSALFSLVVDKSRALLVGLGLVQILLGWSVWLSVRMFNELPRIFLQLTADGAQTWNRMILVKFLVSFLLLLVPCILLGATFPIVSRIVASSLRRVGSDVGRLYAFNTVGAILGSLAAGFVLIPSLGLQNGVLIILGINVLSGATIVWFEPRGTMLARAGLTALALTAIVVAATFTAPWNRETMVSGVYLLSAVYLDDHGMYEGFDRRLDAADLLYYREGRGSTVSVLRTTGSRGDERLSIQIDGKTVASNTPPDMRLQRTIAHLPIMLSPEARNVLVIGLGAGVTAGACAQHLEAEVTVVELEEAVVPAARVFGEYNHHVADDPRVHLKINDGRNHLLMTDAVYDVITVDPIHPFAAGSASLYSREFYQLCRRRLRSRGVMCQWLPLYQLANDDVAMIIRTFQDVFPHSSVWLARTDVGLIGTLEPLQIDLDRLAARMNRPGIRPSLEAVNLVDPYALVSRMILGEDELRLLAGNAPVNRDDHLLLEYSAPRSMYTKDGVVNNLEWLTRSTTSLLPALTPVQTRAHDARLVGFDRQRMERFVSSRDEAILGFVKRPVDRIESLEHFERALALNPDDPDAPDQINLARYLAAAGR